MHTCLAMKRSPLTDDPPNGEPLLLDPVLQVLVKQFLVVGILGAGIVVFHELCRDIHVHFALVIAKLFKKKSNS